MKPAEENWADQAWEIYKEKNEPFGQAKLYFKAGVAFAQANLVHIPEVKELCDRIISIVREYEKLPDGIQYAAVSEIECAVEQFNYKNALKKIGVET